MIKKWAKKFLFDTEYKNKINNLFDKIERYGNSEVVEYLKPIRHDALKSRVGWKEKVSAYVSSHFYNGHISKDSYDEILEELHSCGSWYMPSDARTLDFLLLLIVIPLSVMYLRAIENTLFHWLVFGSLFVVLFSSIMGLRSNSKTWTLRIFAQGFTASSVVSICLAFTMLFFGIIFESLDHKKFRERVTAFESNPQGYQFISKFAKNYYDVDLVLNKSTGPSATPSFSLPSIRQPSMAVGGHCFLNMFEQQNSHRPKELSKDKSQAWLEGVMVHELAHCLDVRRDYERAIVEGKATTLSLAPEDGKRVKTAQDYHEATLKLSTSNWREVVADIMAIGYWSIAYPEEYPDLKNALISLRKGKNEERPHNTLCWVQDIDYESIPSKFESLFQWANAARLTSQCEVVGT